MPFDRVVVSTEEVRQVESPAPEKAPLSPAARLPSPIPWWARIGLSVFALLLPLLCVIAIVLRIAFRNQPPRVKYAWTSFLSTLLVASGFLATVAAILILSLVPVPSFVNHGLPDLDERSSFPALPSPADLSGADVSAKLKPLVVVISPAARLWNHQEGPSDVFGAGVLLHADKDGYLFATANHVVNETQTGFRRGGGHVLVSTESGVWSTADVVANAPQLDMALLWVARNSGASDFVQPIAAASDGENIFAIGHPEGLKFTLSTGIISGLRDQSIQITAAVSPGNSGGPVYDNRGNLVGIVSSKFDNNRDANAENLAFAAKADDLLQESNWTFRGNGRQWLRRYTAAVKSGRLKSGEAKNQKTQE